MVWWWSLMRIFAVVSIFCLDVSITLYITCTHARVFFGCCCGCCSCCYFHLSCPSFFVQRKFSATQHNQFNSIHFRSIINICLMILLFSTTGWFHFIRNVEFGAFLRNIFFSFTYRCMSSLTPSSVVCSMLLPLTLCVYLFILYFLQIQH